MPKEFLISSSENTSFGAKFLKNAADAIKPEMSCSVERMCLLLSVRQLEVVTKDKLEACRKLETAPA